MDRPEWLEEKFLSHLQIKSKYEEVCRAFEECEFYKVTGGLLFDTSTEKFADLYEELIKIWEEVKNGDNF